MKQKSSFIRYPGGKNRILKYILPYIPTNEMLKGRFIEPFVGGGAVFFALRPKNAILSDLNPELINLYKGIREHPEEVWKIYKEFPSTKKAYYRIRSDNEKTDHLSYLAARVLYLNRTCFKGMWRHNLNGEFNVGYGGQDRRWVINENTLKEVSNLLKSTVLKCSDFEAIIDTAVKNDFIFADPPYKPGQKEMNHAHYSCGKFSYADHVRLSKSLKKASARGVMWALTTSSHPDILNLFKGFIIINLPKGTGKKPGTITSNSGEVLIINYTEGDIR